MFDYNRKHPSPNCIRTRCLISDVLNFRHFISSEIIIIIIIIILIIVIIVIFSIANIYSLVVTQALYALQNIYRHSAQ
jgi:ABC-type multidrug transport system permease subunit